MDTDGDGRTELVGTHGEAKGTDEVAWTRTVVRIEAGRAVNATRDTGMFRKGRDDEAIALLGGATCGERSGFEGM